MISKEEARQFKERWRLMDEAMEDEARRTTLALKLHQLALMYEAGVALGWTESLREDEDEVRERWRRLKEKFNV